MQSRRVTSVFDLQLGMATYQWGWKSMAVKVPTFSCSETTKLFISLLRSVHTRRHVAATCHKCRCNTSRRQTTPWVQVGRQVAATAYGDTSQRYCAIFSLFVLRFSVDSTAPALPPKAWLPSFGVVFSHSLYDLCPTVFCSLYETELTSSWWSRSMLNWKKNPQIAPICLPHVHSASWKGHNRIMGKWMLLFHWLINVFVAAMFCRSVHQLRNAAITLILIILSPQQVAENHASLNLCD